MEKQSENQDFTPESTIHLWGVPRKNLGKPTKDSYVRELYKFPELKGVELLPLSLEDLKQLLDVVIDGVKLPAGCRCSSKKEYAEFLKPLGLKKPEKLPLAALQAIKEYVTRS